MREWAIHISGRACLRVWICCAITQKGLLTSSSLMYFSQEEEVSKQALSRSLYQIDRFDFGKVTPTVFWCCFALAMKDDEQGYELVL